MRAAVTRSSLRSLGRSLLGLLTQLGVAIVSAQPLSFIAPRTDFPAGRGPFSVGVGAARQWRRNLRTGSGACAESAMDTLVGGFTRLLSATRLVLRGVPPVYCRRAARV